MAARISDLRRVLAWDQERLAKETGRSPGQVSRWENGHMRPRGKVLAHLCERMGWPKEIFLAGGPMPSDVRPRLADRKAPRAGLAESATDLHTRHLQEAVGPGDQPEGPGWQFGDPTTWDEEQLLNVIRYIERTIRASLSALDDAGRRRVRYVALSEMMRAGKEQGRPLPDFFYRVLHELETGQR